VGVDDSSVANSKSGESYFRFARVSPRLGDFAGSMLFFIKCAIFDRWFV